MPYTGNVQPIENIHHTAYKPSIQKLVIKTWKDTRTPLKEEDRSRQIIETNFVFKINLLCGAIAMTITIVNIIYFIVSTEL